MATREYNRMEDPSDELKRENPDVFHPLVRTHPADGRKALWPSTGTVKGVVGMPNPRGARAGATNWSSSPPRTGSSSATSGGSATS